MLNLQEVAATKCQFFHSSKFTNMLPYTASAFCYLHDTMDGCKLLAELHCQSMTPSYHDVYLDTQ